MSASWHVEPRIARRPPPWCAAHAARPPAAAVLLSSPRASVLTACPCPHPPQILLNKVALSSFSFKSPNALLFFQCLLCVVLVQMCNSARLIYVEPFNTEIVRVWLPVNIIFGEAQRRCLCGARARCHSWFSVSQRPAHHGYRPRTNSRAPSSLRKWA